MNSIKENKNFVRETDWILLLFLFMVANHAVFSLKPLAFLFIYIVRPNFKFGFKKGRIPKFYVYIVILSLVNLFIHVRDFSFSYLTAFCIGNLFWVFCFLAHHQLKLSLEKYGAHGVYRTMQVFIVLNLLFSVGQLARIMLITHKLNPYMGLGFPYGMSTGDKIYGYFLENSYYNMMVSAILAIYFLFKNDTLFSFIALICLLLVFGNTGTIVYISILIMIFILSVIKMLSRNSKLPIFVYVDHFALNKRYLAVIPAILVFIYTFYAVLSPDNIRYTEVTINKELNAKRHTNDDSDVFIDSYMASIGIKHPKGMGEKRLKYNILSGRDGEVIDSNNYKARKAITSEYIQMLKGKKLSLLETVLYLKSSPMAFLFGAGTTRFSSVTAQRMSGIDSSRLFSKILPHYSSPLFTENHRLITEIRLKSKDALLSNANWPDCFYNQILGEYGILGAIIFLIFYVGYFVKQIRYWSYGLWISMMLIPFAILSYMFEPLCVMIFYELLMIADIKENIEMSRS